MGPHYGLKNWTEARFASLGSGAVSERVCALLVKPQMA